MISALEVLVEFARTWVDEGVPVLGSRCVLAPEHIAALRHAFRSH